MCWKNVFFIIKCGEVEELETWAVGFDLFSVGSL